MSRAGPPKFPLYVLSIAVVISCANWMVSPWRSEISRITSSDRVRAAFKDLLSLYEEYEAAKGQYPLTDPDSSDMYKLALYCHDLQRTVFTHTPDAPPCLSMICMRRLWPQTKLARERGNLQCLKISKVEVDGTNASFPDDKKIGLLDPWGTPIVITIPGTYKPVDFVSCGRNRRFDQCAKDDILSWDDDPDRYERYYGPSWIEELHLDWRGSHTPIQGWIMVAVWAWVSVRLSVWGCQIFGSSFRKE